MITKKNFWKNNFVISPKQRQKFEIEFPSFPKFFFGNDETGMIQNGKRCDDGSKDKREKRSTEKRGTGTILISII